MKFMREMHNLYTISYVQRYKLVVLCRVQLHSFEIQIQKFRPGGMSYAKIDGPQRVINKMVAYITNNSNMHGFRYLQWHQRSILCLNDMTQNKTNIKMLHKR